MTFQEIIFKLKSYWADKECISLEPYDLPMGAATFHPSTFLRALGPEPWKAVYIQPCRRPTDGRYGENPNRLQHYYQMQVVLKPSPDNIQNMFLSSLEKIGIDTKTNDIKFVDDNWESPSLGAAGVGWEVWLNGMEISQFTYFQQVGGIECAPVTGELTYGLERIAMHLQSIDNLYDIKWNKYLTYGEIYMQNEKENSQYNFELVDAKILAKYFDDMEKECIKLTDNNLPIPAYDILLQNSHILNLLDSKQAVSSTERQAYILRLRKLSNLIAKKFLESREELEFPLIKEKIIMETKDLLFEIGVEDLPPKNLNSFLEKIKKNIEANLSKESINFSECKFFYTNLRLIFVLQDVITSVNHEKKLIKGPPLSKCFDEENKLTKTGSGFAKKHNISFDQLKKLEKDGVEYVFYEKPKFSQHTKDLLPSILENSLIGVEEQKKK